MKDEEALLQKIDELIARHEKDIDEQLADDDSFLIVKMDTYNQSILNALKKLRATVKQNKYC
jgi:hypothetical protein